jgi:hypothetical protein
LYLNNDPKLDPDRSWLPLDNVLHFDAVLADARLAGRRCRRPEPCPRLGKPAVFDGDVASRYILLDLAARATHAIFSAHGLAVAAQTDEAGLGLERLGKSLPGVVGVTLGATASRGWRGQSNAARALSHAGGR